MDFAFAACFCHAYDKDMLLQEEPAAADTKADNMPDKNSATYVTSMPEQQRQKRKGPQSPSQLCHLRSFNDWCLHVRWQLGTELLIPVPGEMVRHAAVTNCQPHFNGQPHKPHKLVRTQGQFCSGSSKYSPKANHHHANVLRENRTHSVSTTRHHAVVGVAANGLRATVLPQQIATSGVQTPPLGSIRRPSLVSMQKSSLGKPVTIWEQSNTAAPTVGRWSDFIASDADELAANANFAEHSWHSVPGGNDDTDEDACLVTSLD